MAGQQPSPLPTPDDGADPVNLLVCRRMKTKRILLNMSQERLAKAIGISYQQLQRYESGKSRLTCTMMYRASLALDVPITYFFAGILDDHDGIADHGLDKSALVAVKNIQSLGDRDMRQSLMRLIDDLAHAAVVAKRA
jgi:transcriptional regulator with XRE-family HTH domain